MFTLSVLGGRFLIHFGVESLYPAPLWWRDGIEPVHWLTREPILSSLYPKEWHPGSTLWHWKLKFDPCQYITPVTPPCGRWSTGAERWPYGIPQQTFHLIDWNISQVLSSIFPSSRLHRQDFGMERYFRNISAHISTSRIILASASNVPHCTPFGLHKPV